MTIDEIKKLKEIVKANLNEKPSTEWDKGKELLKYQSLAGNCVLVIGSEALLNKNKEEYRDVRGDSEAYLLKCLKSDPETYRRYQDVSSFEDVTNKAELMEDLDHLLDVKSKIWEDDVMEMIDPSLRLLLETKVFRLVITTAFDPLLEYALQKIWNNNLKVINIHDRLYKYDQSKRDIELIRNEFNEISPTLLYAFGKIESKESIYAITDDIKIFTIDCWLNLRKPKNLMQYMQNKTVIAIGCDFEQWVIKFLWYILSNRSGDLSSTIKDNTINLNTSGKVAVNLSLDEEKERISNFLNGKHFTFFDDSRKFSGRLGLEIINQLCNKPPVEGSFFISYAHEDFDIANNVYRELNDGNQKVWFDKRKLLFGDILDDEILKGIETCNYFVPILTDTVIDDLKNNRISKRYYYKEWTKANDEQEKFKKSQRKKTPFIVFPIVTGDNDSVIKDYESVINDYENKQELMPILNFIKKTKFLSIDETPQLYKLWEAIDEQLNRIKQ